MRMKRRGLEYFVLRTYHISHGAKNAFRLYHFTILVWRFSNVFMLRKEVLLVYFQLVIVERNFGKNYRCVSPVFVIVSQILANQKIRSRKFIVAKQCFSLSFGEFMPMFEHEYLCSVFIAQIFQYIVTVRCKG